MDSWAMLLQIILLLLPCLLAGSLMAYLKQSPIVGYLLAGMVMGGPGQDSFEYSVFRDRVGFDRGFDGDSMADQRGS